MTYPSSWTLMPWRAHINGNFCRAWTPIRQRQIWSYMGRRASRAPWWQFPVHICWAAWEAMGQQELFAISRSVGCSIRSNCLGQAGYTCARRGRSVSWLNSAKFGNSLSAIRSKLGWDLQLAFGTHERTSTSTTRRCQWRADWQPLTVIFQTVSQVKPFLINCSFSLYYSINLSPSFNCKNFNKLNPIINTGFWGFGVLGF